MSFWGFFFISIGIIIAAIFIVLRTAFKDLGDSIDKSFSEEDGWFK